MTPKQLQNLFFSPLYVPISSEDESGFVPQVFEVDGQKIAPVFSSAMALARFCGAGTEYVEMASEPFIKDLQAKMIDLGLDFGTDEALHLPSSDLGALLAMKPNTDELSLNVEDFDKIELTNLPAAFAALSEPISEIVAEYEGAFSPAIGFDAALGWLLLLKKTELESRGELWFRLNDQIAAIDAIEAATLVPLDDHDWVALRKRAGLHFHLVAPKAKVNKDQPPVLRY